jgi:predicted 3-demethylubiquinone-9 3-methyltransferase (glyoxalase superfamily)
VGRQRSHEAAEFYASILPDSRVTNVSTLHDTPSGDCDVVSDEMMQGGTKEQIARVIEAFLKMKKILGRCKGRMMESKRKKRRTLANNSM